MMDTKAAFEKWFNQKFELMMRNGLGITAIKRRRELYWEAWQASRAAIEIELPEEKPYKHNSYPEARAQDDGFNDALSECGTIIISHGVRIKGKME